MRAVALVVALAAAAAAPGCVEAAVDGVDITVAKRTGRRHGRPRRHSAAVGRGFGGVSVALAAADGIDVAQALG